MNQITAVDTYLHQARMLHIRGRVDESLAIYKHIIQGMLQNAKQYPQYTDYYRSYAALVLEEAEAIKEMQSKPKQECPFYLPESDLYSEQEEESPNPNVAFPPNQSIPPRSQAMSEVPPRSQTTMNKVPPQSQIPMNKVSPSNPTGLTKSDIQYAAAGVVNQIQQFNNEYQVTEKCKNAYTACTTKAKQLNEQYEISKKAQELGTQIKEWDERNGISRAIVNGVKKAANAVEGAVKDYADKSRNNPDIHIHNTERH